MKNLWLLIPLLLLTACQPTVFGVPQSSWNTLTPAQKQQVIDAYNQREQIKAENAAINSAINAAGVLLKNNQP